MTNVKLQRLNRRAFMALSAGAAGTLALPAPALAQGFPERPIRLIVPFAPGGGSDRLARAVASFLPDFLDETPVLVVNRPGAAGILGHRFFLDQPDDGHFLLSTTMMPNLVNNILFEQAPYSLDDFLFINAQVRQGFVLVTPKQRGYGNVGELVAAIAANPGRIITAQNLLSGGHLATVVMLDALGFAPDAVRLVTYDGGGAPVRAAVAGNQVDFSITSTDGAQAIADRVDFLAVFAPEPIEGYEDVPLINDALSSAGLPLLPASLMESQVYQGIGVHRSFSEKHPDRFDRVVNAYREMLESEGFTRFARASGLMRVWLGPDQTEAVVRAGYELQKQYMEYMQ